MISADENCIFYSMLFESFGLHISATNDNLTLECLKLSVIKGHDLEIIGIIFILSFYNPLCHFYFLFHRNIMQET